MSENGTAEPLKFAYWVPNVSGGLVTSTIDQRTDWGFDYNRELAVRAERAGCTVRFGLNGFLIARDTEAEARETLREFIAKADQPAVEGFRDAVTQAGASTSDYKGMWASSSFEDLVQYNDGFRTRLIGTPDQVARRIVAYKRLGVNLLLLGFLHYHEEVDYFGRHVLPIVRDLEADRPEPAPIGAGHR
jgi:FMNH2-dependent dimethyl sulfone monooxygenase